MELFSLTPEEVETHPTSPRLKIMMIPWVLLSDRVINIAWWPLPAVLTLFFFHHCLLVCPTCLFEQEVPVVAGSPGFQAPFLHRKQVYTKICEKVINLNHFQRWKSIFLTAKLSSFFGGQPSFQGWCMHLWHTHPRNCFHLGVLRVPHCSQFSWAFLHHFNLAYAGNQAGFPKLLIRYHCHCKWNLFFFALWYALEICSCADAGKVWSKLRLFFCKQKIE